VPRSSSPSVPNRGAPPVAGGPATLWDARARRFLEADGRFATVATIDPDGTPHQAVLWFLVTDEGLILNSREGRRWPSNLARDPRASLTVEDGYDYVTMKGRAEVIGDAARGQADIAAMARRYKTPEDAEQMIERTFRPQRRVSFLLRPHVVAAHWDQD
jgi:PPOX class probable F420-dependent enzyme